MAGSDPGPETALPHDTPVTLLVSTGLGEDAWVMPSLLGRDLPGARRQLEALGFRVVAPPGAAAGPVIFQSPAVGARIVRGAVITMRGAGARA